MRQLVCLSFMFLCSSALANSPPPGPPTGACAQTQAFLSSDSLFLTQLGEITRLRFPDFEVVDHYSLEGAYIHAFLPHALGDNVFLIHAVFGTWIIGPDGIAKAPEPVLPPTQMSALAIDAERRFYRADTTAGLAIHRLSDEGEWVTVAQTNSECSSARIHFDDDGTLQGRCPTFLFALENDQLVINAAIQLRRYIQAVRAADGRILWFGVNEVSDVVRATRDDAGAWQLETIAESADEALIAAGPDLVLIGNTRYQRAASGQWNARESANLPVDLAGAAGDWVLAEGPTLYRFDGADYQLVESPLPRICGGDAWTDEALLDGCGCSARPHPGSFLLILLFVVLGFWRATRNHTV
jgi:hypothetical protein